MIRIPRFVNLINTRTFSCQNVLSQLSEHKIQVGECNINYVQLGNSRKSDRAIILLPGALGSAQSDFKPQLEGLPPLLKQHSIIAWDPPGYGKSDPPKSYHLDFYQEDADIAHRLMEKLGLPKYSILGWSDGGITGMIMAADHPEAVNKLVIWGSNAYVIEKETEIYESIRDVSKWSQKMREPMEKMYGEGFKQLWNDWIDTLLKIYKERNGDICKDHLAKIICPTLIVHGAKDPMIAHEHVPYLKEHIKNSEVHIFPEGKHNIHLRYAKEFNDLVVQFLNR